MRGLKKRILCLTLALAMVFSSGCSTITASAVENGITLDNAGNETENSETIPSGDEETTLDNTPEKEENASEETTLNNTSGDEETTLNNAPEDEDETILNNIPGEEEDETTLDNAPGKDGETTLDNAPGDEKTSSDGETTTQTENNNTISFFSGLFRSSDKTLGTGTGTERSTELQDNTTFVIDKYLSDPKGEMNGQDTYDLFLEQGLFDDNVPETYGTEAPEGTYLYFVLDQSSSMAQDPIIDAINEATSSFFTKVQEINEKRMENARNGMYVDIDPDGNVEAQMADHVIKLAGVIGYNNHVYHRYDQSAGLPIVNSSAAARAAEETHMVNDIQEYINSGWTADTMLQVGTRTNLGMQAAEEYINRHGHQDEAFLILVTDGRPNCPEEVSDAVDGTDYNIEHTSDHTVCPYVANQALTAARNLKDQGTTIESLYINWEWDWTTNEAFRTGDIEDIKDQTRFGETAILLSLISSDYPKNGTFNILYDHVASGKFQYEADSRNGFGQYTHLSLDLDSVISDLDSVPSHVDQSGIAGEHGYASGTSRVVDVVTMPFEITAGQEIQVYAVPRIPANLGADGVPTDMDGDGVVTDFRWGEWMTADNESEWVNVTDQVSVSVVDNKITVTGFDYEANALTVFDRDMKNPNYKGANPKAYEPGDYGYKLVVQVPINAKVTFGGNGVATNNPDYSNFYPSVPINRPDLPAWEDNGDLNPEGNDYILKYPLPVVDLNIYYNIVKDDMRIYAPQSAELFNLVSDANAYIFYTDEGWQVANDTMEVRKTAYEEASRAYREYTNVENTDEYVALEQDMLTKKAAYEEAVLALSQYENFTPDGINNQFVDITYELKEPDGDVVGTLSIPHGTAYTGDNLEWNFTKTNIDESGVYTISCTIEPVDTTRSPSGLIYTALDDADTKDAYQYSSTEYSSTGSTAAGSKDPKTLEVNPEAYLFQLHITMDDTRLAPRQTLDFNQTMEFLRDTTNPHMQNWEWVCTDGVTESRAEDEPGYATEEWVGSGIQAVSRIPDSARKDGRVITINSVDAAGDINGSFVPVIMHLMRMTGNLNKNVPMDERTTLSLTQMRDNDDIWGDGLPSVVWEHECVEIDECNASQFDEACDTYGGAYEPGNYDVGPIRYLIHVEQNPPVDPHKTTDTPLIIKGGDIRWNVTLENNLEEENPTHLPADIILVDVLPWNGDTADGRLDPVTGFDGSDFGGDLYYKNLVFDFSEAPDAWEELKSGKSAGYYTTQEEVRTADEAQINGSHPTDSIAWAKVSFLLDDAEMTATMQGVPQTATAIRFDSRMEWGEFISVAMTANIRNLGDQEIGDRYHNRAIVYNGNGGQYTETVATTVGDLYISGMLWEDSDNNGLASANEKRLENVPVKLYRVYNPNNGGSPALTIDGVQLVEAYDTNLDKIPAYITGSDGTYKFNDLQPGTYYVIAEDIAEKYDPTVKGAGTDEQTKTLDSECRETFVNGNDAIIEKIVLTDTSVEHQNFGMKLILGSVKVWKSLDEIYYPTTMTDEEREDYQIAFEFILTNTGTGDVHRQMVRITADNYKVNEYGEPQVYAEFKDLPVGTYTLTELKAAQYELESIEPILDTPAGSVSWNAGSKIMTIKVTSAAREFDLHAKNVCVAEPPTGDLNPVANHINVRVPVSIDVTYTGPDPISSSTATTYNFKQSDFSDIVVTYDDGTQIKLSDGTLLFQNLSFVPGTITNVMNSDSNKVGVTVYYAERGRMVSDSFRVGVDLKPAFRFKLTFNANGSTFKDGSTTNVVNFLYNPGTGHNEVTSGEYKDVANGLMNGKSNFTFTGWNTQPDGMGINYTNLTALDAIGQAGTTDVLTLYATWSTSVTFNANGGTLAGGVTAAEKAIAGRTFGSIPMNFGASASTGLTATRTNYRFVRWNTRPDGTGTNIEDYGRITGPVTFYAVYYQYYFGFTGGVQTFRAPVSGWYTMDLYGGKGGGNYRAGLGGRATGRVHLNAGQVLYVYVGQAGDMSGNPAYNGGAPAGYWVFAGSRIYGGGGGGATDVRYSSSLYSRIIVAGGGGGTDATDDSNGGWGGGGGGLTGAPGRIGNNDDSGSAGGGGGQTYGNALGTGGRGTKVDAGGGGGGYYGGYGGSHRNGGGGGGSGFVSGMSGCATVSGYVFQAASMQTGVNNGNGYATIILYSED